MTYIEHLDDKFRFGKFSGCTFAEVVEFSYYVCSAYHSASFCKE